MDQGAAVEAEDASSLCQCPQEVRLEPPAHRGGPVHISVVEEMVEYVRDRPSLRSNLHDLRDTFVQVVVVPPYYLTAVVAYELAHERAPALDLRHFVEEPAEKWLVVIGIAAEGLRHNGNVLEECSRREQLVARVRRRWAHTVRDGLGSQPVQCFPQGPQSPREHRSLEPPQDVVAAVPNGPQRSRPDHGFQESRFPARGRPHSADTLVGSVGDGDFLWSPEVRAEQKGADRRCAHLGVDDELAAAGETSRMTVEP